MKLTISTVALVALAAMVSAAAAGASQDKVADAQRPATMDAPGMTLTGCVARGTAADTFTLAEVKKGAPVAADASTPAPLVALTGTEVDLSKHVGHSVTLTGSFASPTAAIGTSGTEKPATPATPAATEDSKKATKTFTVKSLKMVSPTCQ